MEAPFIILILVLIIGALIWLWFFISSEFGRIAEDKGFSAQRYRRMCFWLGLIGILMVIALPDRSIGEALYQAKIFFSTPEMFAWTLAIILLSVLLEQGIIWLVRLLSRRLEGGTK